jgi:peptidyl-prolyl cis-trans isomerase A (cyclophilin A)
MMMRSALAAVCVAGLAFLGPAAARGENPAAGGKPMVVLETSKGEVEIELDAEKAPVTVENFLAYVDSGFYDGTIFHRVIPDFMIQGGGFDAGMSQKPTRAPIANEADNGLRNVRGTLAMARTQAKDSATAQFFVNLKDNAFLDHGTRDFGYAVFGRVTRGMDVVDAIAAVPTGTRGGHQNVPTDPVTIQKARRK